MKKILLTIAIILGIQSSTFAQDIYKAILADAKAIVDNPKSNVTLAKIAQFKVTALTYFHDTAINSPHEVTTKFLDDQAYYLNSYVSLFIKEVLVNTKISQQEKRRRINLFIDASGSNPLFNDKDTDVVHAYVTAKNQLTPFSLDTNWVKAYQAVEANLENKEK